MSGWQAYITNLLQSSNKIVKAAIVGLDSSVWARSEPPNGENFTASAEELKELVTLFDDPNRAYTNGTALEGVKYVVPRIEEDLIIGKKDKIGLFAKRIKTAVLIAMYEGETAAGCECRTAMEKLADYLTQNGY